MTVFLWVSGYIALTIAALLMLADLLRYKKTIGQIIGWTASRDFDTGRPEYAPRVRYRTEIGVTREFQACCFMTDRPGPVGTDIPVRYHPTIPWLHGVDRWTHRWLGASLFALVGGLFLGFVSL